jgi:hypothetical protein
MNYGITFQDKIVVDGITYYSCVVVAEGSRLIHVRLSTLEELHGRIESIN